MRLYVDVKNSIDPSVFYARVNRAAEAVAVQAERDMRGFIPSRRVEASAKIKGRKITWTHPLAQIMFHGYIQVDPVTNAGGIPGREGWFSRPGVKKVHSNRQFAFATGGPRWTDRAAEQCYSKWRELARRVLLNGK